MDSRGDVLLFASWVQDGCHDERSWVMIHRCPGARGGCDWWDDDDSGLASGASRRHVGDSFCGGVREARGGCDAMPESPSTHDAR